MAPWQSIQATAPAGTCPGVCPRLVRRCTTGCEQSFSCGRPTAHGFTLIELLVVIGILIAILCRQCKCPRGGTAYRVRQQPEARTFTGTPLSTDQLPRTFFSRLETP
ncbi:MAG: hypothetical protein CMJ81_09030 [Planctomycetaceae bacterium]|nr:hypothetical protein [Planctomycetaceae bacterium]MBP60680.1 hypothetical protein [Planctomycetaceae bacterium]